MKRNYPGRPWHDSLTRRNRRRMLPLLVLFVIGLAACGRSSIEWQEEVQLQSGDLIVVKRTVKTKAFGEIGGPGGWENMGMTLEIITPPRPDNPPLWDQPFYPLIFDRDAKTGQWFVVATFDTCQKWQELGKPKWPFTEFRFKDGQWVQQALSPEHKGREGNMLTTIKSSGEPDLSVAEKKLRMSDPAIVPEFKRVTDKGLHGC